MRTWLFACLFASVVLALSGCDKKGSNEEGGGAVGASCESDGDCESGICLDLHTVDDGCNGKVCTATCEGNDSCPAVADEPDCEGVGERRLCLYGAWESQYCGD